MNNVLEMKISSFIHQSPSKALRICEFVNIRMMKVIGRYGITCSNVVRFSILLLPFLMHAKMYFEHLHGNWHDTYMHINRY